ncbi:MAG TPA: hypothetical protein VHL11_25150, partial [Phototrophicaceae bacterium]|nr:hypothetical protein [Phototrophicaceae bacterium]
MKQAAAALVLIFLLSLIPASSLIGMEQPGNILIFTRYDEANKAKNLYTLNVETGEEQQVATSLYEAGGWKDGHLWLLDSVDVSREVGRLRLLDLDTDSESLISENLILNLNQCYSPLLQSPDQQSIAYFESIDASASPTLTIRQGENENSYNLPFESPLYLSYWTTSGAYLLLHDGVDHVVAVADGSEVISGSNIQFSPDERFVIYQEEQRDHNLQLYELATGERQNLNVEGWVYAWLPTVILIYEPGSLMLWHYELETGELISFEVSGSFESISPDQRYLVINAIDRFSP